MKNFYAILGVDRNATQKEIKKAHRKLSHIYHPDRHYDKPEEERKYYDDMMKEINTAYDVLGDESARAIYDMELDKFRAEEEKKKRAQQRRREQEEKRREQQKREQQRRREQEEQRRQQQRRQRTQSQYSNRTYSSDNTRSQRQYKKEETVFEKLKRYNKEIKEEEKKMSFGKRHTRWDNLYYDMFKNEYSKPQVILIHTGAGLAHVTLEFIYQLTKLGKITDDSVPKYILRNKNLAAAALTGALLFNVFGGSAPEVTPTTDTPTITQEADKGVDSTVDEGDYAVNTNSVLNRVYVVRAGDTLSQLAEDAGVSMNTIKTVNDFTRSDLYYGETIIIPYNVDSDDLQYYIESVEVNGMSLKEIADKYETDVDTLYLLNEEAIERVNGSYIITSYSIYVPNFISRDELKEMKESHQYTNN